MSLKRHTLIISALIYVLMSPIDTPASKKCVQIGQQQYFVDFASTAKQQEKGLAGKTHLSAKAGMVFPLEKEEEASVWMKGCKIPLDILFFRKKSLVTYVDEVQPCPISKNNDCMIYKTPVLVDTIVELKAGTRKKYNYNEYTTLTSCK